jgi:hypothetical protein
MHFHRFALAVVIVSAGLLGLIGRARADFIPQVEYDNMQFNTTTFNSAVGYSFTTGGSAITIDALGQLNGLVYLPGSGTTVRLYELGASANLASVVIDTNDQLSSTTAFGNSFYYESIAPLTLDPLTTYVIVADVPLSHAFSSHASNVATLSGITPGAAVSGLAGNFPANDGAYAIGPYFNVSFSVATVPEPSSLGLAALGAAVLCAFRCRKRMQNSPGQG